jgi:hypothetical protein
MTCQRATLDWVAPMRNPTKQANAATATKRTNSDLSIASPLGTGVSVATKVARQRTRPGPHKGSVFNTETLPSAAPSTSWPLALIFFTSSARRCHAASL